VAFFAAYFLAGATLVLDFVFFTAITFKAYETLTYILGLRAEMDLFSLCI
jgi:hypothetical protein